MNTSVVKNLGTIILGSVGVVIAMILTVILTKFSHKPLVKKISDLLREKLFYNSLLRTFVQSYLKFSILAFASLDNYKDKTTLGTGIFFMFFSIFFFIFAHMFLKRNRSNLGQPTFSQRFSSLYLNIDTENPHSYYLTTLFLGRRFILGIILSFCDNY